MGGVLILFSMLVSLFLWMDLTHVFTLILLLTTLVLGFLGGRDDYLKLKYKNTKGLSARKKLLLQLCFSGLLALYLLSPTVAQSIQIGDWFSQPVIKEQLTTKGNFDPAMTKDNSSFHQGVQVPLTLKEYSSRIYAPFLKGPLVILSGVFTILAGLFIMFVITGSSNAVNLTDGLDGLAAGCLILVAACWLSSPS